MLLQQQQQQDFVVMFVFTYLTLSFQEPPRKERDTSGVFETSRWTPVVMDIMEAVVHEKNLDTSHYPFFHAESQVNTM